MVAAIWRIGSNGVHVVALIFGYPLASIQKTVYGWRFDRGARRRIMAMGSRCGWAGSGSRQPVGWKTTRMRHRYCDLRVLGDEVD